MSSLEGESYARCFVPGNDSAELIGYSKWGDHDDLNVGRFEGWGMVFRYEGVVYSAWAQIGRAGSRERDYQPQGCALGNISVMDSIVLVPTATAVMSDIDPFDESYKPYMIHAMPCLGWSWDTQANSQAVVSFFPDWEGAPYRAVIFDDAGEVARVCSKNACDGGQVEYCCE